MELGLVLLCTMAPLVISSAVQFYRGRAPSGATDSAYLMMMLRQVSDLLLLWYVLQRSDRSFGSIGLKPSWDGIAVGVGLFLLGILGMWIAKFAILRGAANLASASAKSHALISRTSLASPWTLFLYATVDPWHEELIVRAFLMTELSALSGSMGLAVVASTVLQASYHLYQGWINASTLSVIFLISALYFAKTRRIFPVICGHMMQDYFATWYQVHNLHSR